MLKRKLEEIGSILYRSFVFPFQRIAIEIRTKSVLKQGSYLNKGTVLEGRNYVGKETVLSNVRLGFGSYVSNAGDLSNVKIGRYCAIGPEVKMVLGRHPVDGKHAALHPAFYSASGAMGFTYVPKGEPGSFEEAIFFNKESQIQVIIGNDVWIGQDVRILEGVTIGDGAVIAAGSIVTKDIEPYGVYAGVPAKKIKSRFDKEIAEKLLQYKWWEKDEAWIHSNITAFEDVEQLIRALEEDIGHGS